MDCSSRMPFLCFLKTFPSEDEAKEAVASLCVKKMGILSGGEGGGMTETTDTGVCASRVVEIIGEKSLLSQNKNKRLS